MSYLGLLNTTCAIYRNTATTDGPYGGQTLTLQSSGVKCRLEMMSAREMVGQAQAVVSTHRLFLPASVDIRPEDVVQVSSVDYLVQFVDDSPGGKAHHIECMCKRVA